MKKMSWAFLTLGMAVMVLSTILSVMGLLWEGLYQDTNMLIRNGWRINDWVTLVISTPLFLIAIGMGRKGSKHGYALLTGLMVYTIYNYSYYLFGAAFNAAFLGYVFVYVMGLFGLPIGIYLLYGQLRKEDLPSIRLSRGISIYMILTAIFLSIGWIGQWVSFVGKGVIPPLMEQLGTTNHLVAALDMTLVVPWFLFGAFLLWKRSIFGLIVSLAVNVKAAIYNVILLWSSIDQLLMGNESAAGLIPLWVFFLIGSAVSLLICLRSIK